MTGEFDPRTVQSSDEQRRQLQHEIRRYVAEGYRVLSQSDSSAQLVKPKKFRFGLALVLLFTAIGFLVYLIWFLSRRERAVYIEVSPSGQVLVNGYLPSGIASNSRGLLKPILLTLLALAVIGAIADFLSPNKKSETDSAQTAQIQRAPDASGDERELELMRMSTGLVACNDLNGAYRGRIVGAEMYPLANGRPVPVWVLERNERRIRAPRENTSVAFKSCPDGQPE
jgi:hypothetical protein